MTLPLSVTSEYTKKNLMEMNTAVHRRTRRIYLLLSAAGALLAFLGGLGLGRIEGIGALLFAGIIWTVLMLIFANKQARRSTRATVKSNLKHYGAPVRTTVKFYNTMLTAKNETTGSEVRAQYENVAKLLRTKRLYVLVLEEGRTLMVDRSGLDHTDAGELWELLQEHCTAALVQVHG